MGEKRRKKEKKKRELIPRNEKKMRVTLWAEK